MNINNKTQYNTFKGYQNLLSNTYVSINGTQLSYMAMELNNEKVKDLDNWIDIQKNLFNIEKPSKFIVLNTIAENQKAPASIELNNIVLGSYLEKQEKHTLKAYTLLASLTKRIAIADFFPENGGIRFTLITLLDSLSKAFAKKSAEYLTTSAAMKLVKHQKTASIINSQIHRRMLNHFSL